MEGKSSKPLILRFILDFPIVPQIQVVAMLSRERGGRCAAGA
jgi:hypothetical protein